MTALAPNPCPPAVRDEILTRFDDCLESSTGIILYPINQSRIKYLTIWSQFLKEETILESVAIYEPDDELYARGLYWAVRWEPSSQGLIYTRHSEVHRTDAQLIINAAYGAPETITYESPEKAKTQTHILRVKRRILHLRARVLALDADPLMQMSIIENGPDVQLFASTAAPTQELTLEELKEMTTPHAEEE